MNANTIYHMAAKMRRDCDPHIPAIMHRTGGPSSEELNVCGLCGSSIAPRDGKWTAIGDQEEDRIRSLAR